MINNNKTNELVYKIILKFLSININFSHKEMSMIQE